MRLQGSGKRIARYRPIIGSSVRSTKEYGLPHKHIQRYIYNTWTKSRVIPIAPIIQRRILTKLGRLTPAEAANVVAKVSFVNGKFPLLGWSLVKLVCDAWATRRRFWRR